MLMQSCTVSLTHSHNGLTTGTSNLSIPKKFCSLPQIGYLTSKTCHDSKTKGVMIATKATKTINSIFTKLNESHSNFRKVKCNLQHSMSTL